MFISEELVFIELHKTGCSHIIKLLSKLLEGHRIGKHNPATPDLLNSGKIFVGSIRNPWEWYVSLWAYGCDKKGAIYSSVIRPKGQLRALGWRNAPLRAAHLLLTDYSRDSDKWKRCYTDVNDASGFREWLHMINSQKYWNDFGGEYGSSTISNFAGLLTYRYVTLFCKAINSKDFKGISSYSDLRDFCRRQCYIDYFIQNEKLEADFISVLEKCGLAISDEAKGKVFSSGKTNISSRKQKANYYYDSDALKLVYDREQLIIEKFGYKPPALVN